MSDNSFSLGSVIEQITVDCDPDTGDISGHPKYWIYMEHNSRRTLAAFEAQLQEDNRTLKVTDVQTGEGEQVCFRGDWRTYGGIEKANGSIHTQAANHYIIEITKPGGN